MAAALLCAVTAAALTVSPDRSQHFTISDFTVRCPSDSWSVYRTTSFENSSSLCGRPWGRPRGSGCLVGPTLRSDSGRYWCQDKQRPERCSPAVNVTVYDRAVILETPLFPITEGQNVTLSCFYRAEEHHKPQSDFLVKFFKNEEFIGTFPGGKMSLTPVSKADEGQYMCEHPSKAQSLQSTLIVKELSSTTASVSPSPPPPQEVEISLYRVLCFVFLFVLDTVILSIGLSVYCRWKRAQAEEKNPESERVSLRRVRNP